jgi:predicted acetyltransferase
LLCKFRRADPENWLINDIVVRELLYADAAALHGLLAFLQTQADQIERIHFHSFDDDLHLLFNDVRDGSDHLIPSVYHQSNRQGVGLMYRVIDLPALLAGLPERKGVDGLPGGVRLTLQDSFYSRSEGSWVLGWGDGRPRILPETRADVELTLDIAEFSSWMMGVTDLATLLRLGLARLSKPSAAPLLAEWFDFARKPVCYTHC